jgi:hypothetical protein
MAVPGARRADRAETVAGDAGRIGAGATGVWIGDPSGASVGACAAAVGAQPKAQAEREGDNGFDGETHA